MYYPFSSSLTNNSMTERERKTETEAETETEKKYVCHRGSGEQEKGKERRNGNWGEWG